MSLSPSNEDLFSPVETLTTTGVETAMNAANEEALSQNWSVTICVCDAGGVPIQVKRSDGAFAASYDVAVGKARTAALFRKETGKLEASANVQKGIARTALLSAPFILMRGGVPIIKNGVCCGAVGVSGVQPEQDEQVAMAAVAVLVPLASKL